VVVAEVAEVEIQTQIKLVVMVALVVAVEEDVVQPVVLEIHLL
tara:strand:+ start:346 stop:474 length:129 start_codon:yes stop_codon:yes gene_type:complete